MTGTHLVLEHPLVIGAGVAGMSVALALPEATVIAAGAGSTRLAQGGVAAAVGPDDTPGLHNRDTIAVSGGLASQEAVEILCQGGPAAVEGLQRLGARFDRRSGGELRLGLEAGHTRRRIVAAQGDSIGRELDRAMGQAVAATPRIDVRRGWTATALLSDGEKVTGAMVTDPAGGQHVLVCRGVVVASGGAGHLYRHTTNPADVNGSGIALAGHAGARLADLEFVQFHPTALDVGKDPMPLVSEALRGEGALLVDDRGDRFLADAHPDAELAPRDVVARAVWRRRRRGRRTYLDARGVEDVATRFPTVAAHARSAGLDPATDLLPVAPAAHYTMGGIDVDTHGRSSLANLWAVGEASSTGVHGANRLASNSLLEGLVFAARSGADIAASARLFPPAGTEPDAAPSAHSPDPVATEALREVMWEEVGVVRTGVGLQRAAARISGLRPELDGSAAGRAAAALAGWMVAAAAARRESRGSHYRADLPGSDPARARRHRFVPGTDAVEVAR